MIHTDTKKINRHSLVADIVNADYRTADIFRKYAIEFCCGGRRSLAAACASKYLDTDIVQHELELATRSIQLPASLNFDDWSVDFLTDYIVNIHHQYLKRSFPPAKDYLQRFVEGHQKKYTYLDELLQTFNNLSNEILPHLEEEEAVIFPYIRQIAHAYQSSASYATLLVRTLRKPVESMLLYEHKVISGYVDTMRQLTDHYIAPQNACINHKVTLLKLQEIDNDLVQHLNLEINFLFPKAVNMEKELLAGRV